MNSVQLQFNFKQLAHFLNSLHEAIILVDESLHIVLFNAEAESLFQYTSTEVLNKHLNILVPTRYHETHNQQASNFISAQQEARMMGHRSTLWAIRADGSQFPVEISLTNLTIDDKKLTLAVIRDESREYERELKFKYQAEHDLLTGLCNRNFLISQIDSIIETNHTDKVFSLFFVDLDKFKPVNDEYGHETGDHLLSIVAKRLLSCVRSNDLVCRFGGDEFVFLIDGCTSKKIL